MCRHSADDMDVSSRYTESVMRCCETIRGLLSLHRIDTVSHIQVQVYDYPKFHDLTESMSLMNSESEHSIPVYIFEIPEPLRLCGVCASRLFF